MSLSTIRDLLIVIGIYLYFIAWVYLHAYYESFGISTESLKLDYSSYLVFSYNVITSRAFVVFAVSVMCGLLLAWGGYTWMTRTGRMAATAQLLKTIKPVVTGIAMVLLFPILFGMSRDAALSNYAADRTNTGERHRIEFVFRADAGFAKRIALPDSGQATNSNPVPSDYDLQLLSTDYGKTLRFLGETDEYFIVLHQAQDPGSARLPEGAIYYIDKKDVLLSHIILSSR